jgi:hypothetical protein
MKSTERAIEKLQTIQLTSGDFRLEYCPNPLGIEKYFSPEVRLASFPPDGIAGVCELDVFYLIKRGDEVVGYFKAVDLFFDGVIELHGSYNGPTDFSVKKYFFLGKNFAHTVQKMFPKKQILTYIQKDNKKILGFLKWLKFLYVNKQPADSRYILYRYADTSMFSIKEKILHYLFTFNRPR